MKINIKIVNVINKNKSQKKFKVKKCVNTM